MSDTDDTDFLLLIPPDFFVVRSPHCVSPLHHVSHFESDVNVLLDPCKNLENTLFSFKNMENEPTSYLNKYRNESYHILNGSDNRNNESLTPSYLNSSPREKQTKQKINKCNMWLPKTDSLIQDSTEIKTDEFLLEIPIQHCSNVPDNSKLSDKILSSTENVSNILHHDHESKKFNLFQVDQLLNEMEKTRADIRNKLQLNKSKIYEMKKEYANNNTDRGFGENKHSFIPRIENDSLFETRPVAAEIFEKNENSISKTIKNGVDYSTISNSIKKQLNTDTNIALPRDPKNMLQLSKIMSKENNVETLQQKLEAEILKKKHCEEIIQKLQLNLLEQQENLNVAQKIDAEKEEVIMQLRSAWVQLVEHWKELEQQRQELALMLENERFESRNAITNSNQKIEQLEIRLHELISLAAGYQEKSEQTEKFLKELQESTNEFENNFKKNEEYVKLVEIEKSKLLEQLTQTNENLTKEKQKCFSLESKITDLENQSSRLAFEKNELIEKLQEEKKLMNTLNSEIIKIKENYNQAYTADLASTKELNAIKQETMKMKNNLKEFYQKQLDKVLREKVDEYQKEIQKAQLLMHQELLKQEKVIEERSQLEIRRLQDSHKIELSEERRINQKHVNILKAELKESRKKIYELENCLKKDSASKTELTKRIQSVLKNHCLDGRGIISDNENFLKGTSTNINEIFSDDDKEYEVDNHADHDISRIELRKMSTDLKKYISMLLTKEPGNPIYDFKNLELMLSHNELESEKILDDAQKKADNFRKKPPWK